LGGIPEESSCPSRMTPRSRINRVEPRGARSVNAGSMYRCHRSAGSITCISESITLKPFFAMMLPPYTRWSYALACESPHTNVRGAIFLAMARPIQARPRTPHLEYNRGGSFLLSPRRVPRHVGITVPITEFGAALVGLRDFVQAAAELGHAHVRLLDHVLSAAPEFHLEVPVFPSTHQSYIHNPLILMDYFATAHHQSWLS